MKIDKEKINEGLKNFDENSDYYVAVAPDEDSKTKIINILTDQRKSIDVSGLKIRTADYLHMTAIYLPALNKINQELVKINVNVNLSKDRLVEFIRNIFDQNYDDKNYVVEKVGYLGKRSISLWMKGNILPAYKYAIREFKKLIIDSGLSEKEFQVFVQNAGFSVLKYYKDQKFLAHIGIINVPKDVIVTKDILDRLTELYKSIEIKVNRIELRNNSKCAK